MAIRKMTKRQTMIYKTVHRKQKIEQHEPHTPLSYSLVVNMLFIAGSKFVTEYCGLGDGVCKLLV
jgi:hypothetical protein